LSWAWRDRDRGRTSEKLWAAVSIKPDEASALLVIEVQNCFLPGGSLAVKDGKRSFPLSTASPGPSPMW